MRLLMITGDRALAQGKKGPFYYTLEEFSKHWDRIDIICPKILARENKIEKVHGNVFIHSSPWPLWKQPKFILKKGLEIFKQQKFDLFTIHSYPPFYNDIGGLRLFKKIKTPYVLEVMHITGYPKAGNLREWFYRFLTGLFINYFSKNSKAVRVINKKQVPEFLINKGVEKNKIKYIPAFYIDFNIFKPMDLKKEYDLIFSGRFVKNKGIFLLLDAMKQNEMKDFKLAIIGSGPLEGKIKKYVHNNGLEKNIEFVGWLPGVEDLARIYNKSKIMIMPSFNEGGPRVNLEAMACKIPVITSRVGIMLDVIEDPSTNSGQVPSTSSGQANGLFVDWNVEDIVKKTNLLLKDKNLYKKIAENGFETIQQFERKKAINNYAESYKNLLRGS